MRPIIISPRPLPELLPSCAPPPAACAASGVSAPSRGRRRRSPPPLRPPAASRRGLRKPRRRQSLPQQLARRLLKPPRDLGKNRRFNPIPIAPTLPSNLTRFSSTLVFGYRYQAYSGFPPIHGSLPRRPPLPPAPPPPRAASPVCSTADAGHAYARCRTVVSSGSGASRCGLFEFDRSSFTLLVSSLAMNDVSLV